MGLDSVGVDEIGFGNDQIQDPMSLVTVTGFGNGDALVVTEDGDAATDTVVIYVDVVSLEKADRIVNCVKGRQGDGD